MRSNLHDAQKTLLVWDLFAAHRDSRVLSFLRSSSIDVIFIPGGCTSVCQVMDIVVNRPFKAHVRNAYISWRATQITAQQPWVAPKRNQVIDWVLDSWHQFPVESLHEGIVKYVLTPALAVPTVSVHPPPDPDEGEDVEALIGAISELALPTVPVLDEAEDVSHPSSSSDEAMSLDEGQGAEIPDFCVKCERPLRESNRVSCKFCGIWVHPGCQSTNHQGRCSFCP